MKVVVDTCGWIEWLTDGVLADEFAPFLADFDNLIVPTSIAQQEKARLITADDHFENLPAVSYFSKK